MLEGTIGVRIGDEIAEAGPGTYVFKPRNVKRAFWNPTDAPARVLEIIVPAGFEEYSAESAQLFTTGAIRGGPEHRALLDHYGLEPAADWIPELKAKFGLKMLGES